METSIERRWLISGIPYTTANYMSCTFKTEKFTWSNEREAPTLVKPDRVFCNKQWNLSFGSHVMQALSTSHSNHYPLLLMNAADLTRPRPFKFKNF